jgi:hypothetical protein
MVPAWGWLRAVGAARVAGWRRRASGLGGLVVCVLAREARAPRTFLCSAGRPRVFAPVWMLGDLGTGGCCG